MRSCWLKSSPRQCSTRIRYHSWRFGSWPSLQTLDGKQNIIKNPKTLSLRIILRTLWLSAGLKHGWNEPGRRASRIRDRSRSSAYDTVARCNFWCFWYLTPLQFISGWLHKKGGMEANKVSSTFQPVSTRTLALVSSYRHCLTCMCLADSFLIRCSLGGEDGVCWPIRHCITLKANRYVQHWCDPYIAALEWIK